MSQFPTLVPSTAPVPSVIGLNLPTDVPWEQFCVTSDMMADAACELCHPPKGQSSIAVAKYVPEEEYQVYPGCKITYLKVTCTITEGKVNFRGADVMTVQNVDSLLDSYHPCTGALIQGASAPRAETSCRRIIRTS